MTYSYDRRLTASDGTVITFKNSSMLHKALEIVDEAFGGRPPSYSLMEHGGWAGKTCKFFDPPTDPKIKKVLEVLKKNRISYELTNERRAAALPDPAFTRMVSSIGDIARAMELQVKRLGGVEAALQRGHGQTLQQQLHDIQTSARVLQRRLGLE